MQGSQNQNWQKKGYRYPSIEIASEWTLKQEFTKQNLDKLHGVDFKMIETLAEAGEIFSYNNAFDRARLRKGEKKGDIKLPEFKSETNIGSCITVADPIIQKLCKENQADVYATDVALAALMCATKAQFAWDIVIKKFGSFIFIDKRDAENMLDW